MFIQTEPTPNPATIKFIPGETVLAQGSAEFKTAESATGKSPLAERLFKVRAAFFLRLRERTQLATFLVLELHLGSLRAG